VLNRNSHENLLKRIDALGREIERLKRDLLLDLATEPERAKPRPSLFGSVPAGDITEEMVEDAKQALFRNLEDL